MKLHRVGCSSTGSREPGLPGQSPQHPGAEGLVASRWGNSSQAQPVGQTDTG